MSTLPFRPGDRINLSNAEVLLIDGHAEGREVLTQMFAGFGVHTPHICAHASEAMEIVKHKPMSLMVVDSALPDMDGFEWIKWLRRSGLTPNAYAPVILMTGHTKTTEIFKGRDSGANFVVRKPAPPMVMLQRILWVSKDVRPFVDAPNYCGPDRRFQAMGPPVGMRGRRKDDLSVEIGEATTPNLDQDDIDALFKPKRAM